jgi:hypothetical protein
MRNAGPQDVVFGSGIPLHWLADLKVAKTVSIRTRPQFLNLCRTSYKYHQKMDLPGCGGMAILIAIKWNHFSKIFLGV